MTEGFQDVSQRIQVAEKNITDNVIKGMVRALQEGEKEKLEKVKGVYLFRVRIRSFMLNFSCIVRLSRFKF